VESLLVRGRALDQRVDRLDGVGDTLADLNESFSRG